MLPYDIASIRFDGGTGNEHGNDLEQVISWPFAGSPDAIVYNPDSGSISIGTEGNTSTYKPFTPMLTKKLAPTAIIYLTGCETAKGENNLAKALSKALGTMYPHVTVTGNTDQSRYLFGKYPTITSPKSYINGKETRSR